MSHKDEMFDRYIELINEKGDKESFSQGYQCAVSKMKQVLQKSKFIKTSGQLDLIRALIKEFE